MSSADLLFEIGTEELPPKSLNLLIQALSDHIENGLKDAQLTHGPIQRFASPRRLAVLIPSLVTQQPDQTIERKGPPVKAAFAADGQPTRAATAFAESVGIPVSQLERIQEPKGEFLFHRGVRPGRPTKELLPDLFESSIQALPIAKRMRWGSSTAEFVRPVHWIVLLLGTDVVPCELFKLKADRITYGHRFMSPSAISLQTPSEYEAALQAAFVIADPIKRRKSVVDQITHRAHSLKGEAVMRESLIDEVTALIEWPVAVMGQFDERFLNLPSEVLTATLEDHQRYFSVKNTQGELTTHFITIANIQSKDESEVRRGNERVIRPRLADAEFFWHLDQKTTPEQRLAELSKVTFQVALGSYKDKTDRLVNLIEQICIQLQCDKTEISYAKRAALLCKTDLISGMVGEFPELQGTMGGYYATLAHEPVPVAQAISQQYHPRFAQDTLPTTTIGIALALADKIDTIASIFAIGQKPSGTKDPYALRRQALGVLRIILENKLPIDLRFLLRTAIHAGRAQATTINPKEQKWAPLEEVEQDLVEYVFERLRGALMEDDTGITTEVIDSVMALNVTSPFEFKQRVLAVKTFLGRAESASITQAQKRIVNLLKKSDPSTLQTLSPTDLTLAVERSLWECVESLKPKVAQLVAQQEYTQAILLTAQLSAPIDAFFEGVMVMDDDLSVRARRLSLLQRVRELFLSVADLSALPG